MHLLFHSRDIKNKIPIRYVFYYSDNGLKTMCRVFIGSSVIIDLESTAVKSASSKNIGDVTVTIEVAMESISDFIAFIQL